MNLKIMVERCIKTLKKWEINFFILKYLIYLFLVFSITSYSQSYSIEGVVRDSIGNPLVNVNFIAKTDNGIKNPSFTISDENGNYKLKLDFETHYIITVSHISYNTFVFYSNNKHENIDIFLTEKKEQLKEVVLDVPIVFKKDTVTYNINSFISGNERKLKEVLKKLPGVEVDKNGIVTVQGQKIDKMLVEGKEFFGGNSHLAVENIPANAIDKVEVISNYQKISFLKDFENSDILAMNIKLNQDKKKFLFGDLIAGYGIEQKYLAHSNSFYYSPKTTVNFIGNINNNGYIPFTFNDYLFYEGGINKMIDNSKKIFKSIENNFNTLFEDIDFLNNESKFVALNFTNNINLKTEIGSYYIFNTENIDKEEIINNKYYIDNDLVFLEVNNNSETSKSLKNIGKIFINYSPDPTERFDYEIIIKWNDFTKDEKKSNLLLNTLSDFNNEFNTYNKSINQNFEWHKKISSKHVFSLFTNHYLNKSSENSNWNSNQKFLSGIADLINDVSFDVYQKKPFEYQFFNISFKDFFIINNLNHLYTTIGYSNNLQSLFTHNLQLLSNGESIDLEQFGFGNKVKTRLNDFYWGFQYKIKREKTVFLPGLHFHYYYKMNQQSETINSKQLILLPELEITKDIKKSEKLTFKYQLKNNFFNTYSLVKNYFLENYNSIINSNIDYSQELTHSSYLYYSKFSIYRNLLFYTSFNFQFKNKKLVSEKKYIEANQISTYKIAESPNWNYQFQMELRKGVGNFNFQIRTNLLYSNHIYYYENQIFTTNRLLQDYKIKISTNFENHPNFDIGFDRNTSHYEKSATNFSINSPYIEFSYKLLKNWLIKTDYKLDEVRLENKKSQINSNLNFSLFYQKENRPFEIEVNAKNLLNAEYIYSSYEFDNIITNTKKNILPRIIMFNLNYKF